MINALVAKRRMVWLFVEIGHVAIAFVGVTTIEPVAKLVQAAGELKAANAAPYDEHPVLQQGESADYSDNQ